MFAYVDQTADGGEGVAATGVVRVMSSYFFSVSSVPNFMLVVSGERRERSGVRERFVAPWKVETKAIV